MGCIWSQPVHYFEPHRKEGGKPFRRYSQRSVRSFHSEAHRLSVMDHEPERGLKLRRTLKRKSNLNLYAAAHDRPRTPAPLDYPTLAREVRRRQSTGGLQAFKVHMYDDERVRHRSLGANISLNW